MSEHTNIDINFHDACLGASAPSVVVRCWELLSTGNHSVSLVIGGVSVTAFFPNAASARAWLTEIRDKANAVLTQTDPAYGPGFVPPSEVPPAPPPAPAALEDEVPF